MRDQMNGVPERMKLFEREYRFIYLVREPIARIESHINFALHMHPIAGWTTRSPTVPAWLVRMTDYHAQLSEYRKHFPAEDLLVLDFHDYITRPTEALQQIEDFLAIDHHNYADTRSAHNVTADISTPSRLWYALRSMQLFRTMTRRLPFALRSELRNFASRPNTTNFVLNARQKAYIRNQLRTSMQNLSKDYNINVEAWGHD